MANIEWSVPHTITSPLGDLQLNTTDPYTGRRFQILQDNYRVGPTLRVTQDNISQSDGSVLHPRFKTGYSAAMTVSYWIMPSGSDDVPHGSPACARDAREMNDVLLGHLNAMRRLTTSTQRLLWTPTGYSNRRMLEDVQLSEWPTTNRDGIETSQSFILECPFPYAVDLLQIETDIVDAGTALVANAGTADFFPVIQVGASTGFTIEDTDSGLMVVYDSTRAGAVAIVGSAYAEIDFFRGTIHRNGDGADLIAGIDPAQTDFFPIPQNGGAHVFVNGADIKVLSNAAWS